MNVHHLPTVVRTFLISTGIQQLGQDLENCAHQLKKQGKPLAKHPVSVQVKRGTVHWGSRAVISLRLWAEKKKLYSSLQVPLFLNSQPSDGKTKCQRQRNTTELPSSHCWGLTQMPSGISSGLNVNPSAIIQLPTWASFWPANALHYEVHRCT